MNSPIGQAIIVCALAVAAWIICERFAPDPLLDKLVKLVIFVAMVIWIATRLLPRLV